MENKNFNGFKNKFRLAEITAKIEDVIERNFSITEFVDLTVSLSLEDSIIYVELTVNTGSRQIKMTIELWADNNVEVVSESQRIYWDIIDTIAELREMLIDGEFDEYFEEN